MFEPTQLVLATYLKPRWEILQGLGLLDFLTLPVIIGISIYFAAWLSGSMERIAKRLFYPALLFSILSGLLFATVYNYYYVGGDTFWYYHYSYYFRHAFEDNFLIGVKLFFAPTGSTNPEFYEYTAPIWHLYFHRADGESIFLAKLIGATEFIFFPSYWVTTVVFSLFSFSGRWVLFRYCSNQYPEARKWLAVSTLFIPSILFWGSGVIKDTVCIGALSWLLYHTLQLIDSPKGNLHRIIYIIPLANTILLLKAYIVLALVPAIALYLFARKSPNPNANFLKILVAPLFAIVLILSTNIIITGLAASSTKYQLDQLEKRAEGFRSYHSYLARTEGQSFYNLGEISYTPLGILSKSPAAFNVTYFRPYLWEVDEPLQIISAIESLVIMAIVLLVIKRTGLLVFFRNIGRDPLVLLFVSYSIIFGVSVGITAYNFGALVRFKIPGVMLFLIAISILASKASQAKLTESQSDS